MDHGRVEVGTLVEGRDDDGGRKAGRDLGESIMSAVEAPWDVGLEGEEGGGSGALLKLSSGAMQQSPAGTAQDRRRGAYPGVPREPHLHG